MLLQVSVLVSLCSYVHGCIPPWDGFKIKWEVNNHENCGYELSLEADTFQLSQFYSTSPCIIYRGLLTQGQKRNIERIYSSTAKPISKKSLCPDGWKVSFNKYEDSIVSADSCTKRDEQLVCYLLFLLPIKPNFSIDSNAKWDFDLMEFPTINQDYKYTQFHDWKYIELKISHSGWYDITDNNWTIRIQENYITCYSLGVEVGKRILSTSEMRKINTYLSKIDFNSKFVYYIDIADQIAAKLIVDGKILCVESPIIEDVPILSRYNMLIDYIQILSPVYE